MAELPGHPLWTPRPGSAAHHSCRRPCAGRAVGDRRALAAGPAAPTVPRARRARLVAGGRGHM